MEFLQARELAEVRHDELLEQVAQRRPARRGAASRRESRHWSQAVRDAVTVLRAYLSAAWRPDLPQPADLTPDAETA